MEVWQRHESICRDIVLGRNPRALTREVNNTIAYALEGISLQLRAPSLAIMARINYQRNGLQSETSIITVTINLRIARIYREGRIKNALSHVTHASAGTRVLRELATVRPGRHELLTFIAFLPCLLCNKADLPIDHAADLSSSSSYPPDRPT